MRKAAVVVRLAIGELYYTMLDLLREDSVAGEIGWLVGWLFVNNK